MRTLLLFLSLLCVAIPAAAAPNDLHMKATLIWGCDEEKPKDEKIKPVTPEMAARLKGIFKWKHYFMITNMTARIPEKTTHTFVLSDKCKVDIANKNETKAYQAKLFGENKLLKQLDQPTKLGEDVVLAGDDKNATAWFVILTPQPVASTK
jgi:hypothetical protein